jgi:(p)ppGpp synthase/HD superfamily hydrolase
MYNNLVHNALQFAIFAHGNQMYGNFPYIVHLSDVHKILREYHYDDEEILAASFLHDTIEDCGVSREMIEARFGEKVAKYVWAVSGFGANRKERKADMLAKLQDFPKAVSLKMADRYANILNCQTFNPRLLEMYKKEYSDYDTLFETADSFLNSKIRKILI